MTRFAVLLRGVNVGGRRVAMPELRRTAEDLGYADVSTYINSGNLLLSTRKSAKTLVREMEAALEREFGFAVPVMVRTAAQLRTVMEANPYPEGNPSQVTVAFLSDPAQGDAARRMADVATDEERFTLTDSEVYVDFAGGLGRSKLAARLERLLGTGATVRNIRTVEKLLSLLDD